MNKAEQDPLQADTLQHCDLCGEQWPGRLYGQATNYQLLRCERCNLIWANPLKYHRLIQNETSSASSYWAEEVYLSNADYQKTRFYRQLKITLKNLGVYNPKSLNVLEIGSGFGYFLDVCEEFGIMAEGCDVSERAVLYANHRIKRTRLGTLDNYYADESFDIVFGFNLIEHLSHPQNFFQQARRVLKLGGVLVLETPIQESLFHRLARVGYVLSGSKLNFYGVGPGGHIYKFSERTFKFICEDMGFCILYQKNINSPFGEIWGKSSIVRFDYGFVYRLSLPITWIMAKLTGQGNRVFIILRKIP